MRKKHLGTLLLGMTFVLVILTTGSWLRPANSSKSSQVAGQVSTTLVAPANSISYPGVDGRSALDLLGNNHEVVTKDYPGTGELVTGIDGVVADDHHFWAFYINDQLAQIGADNYKTKSTDTISWKLEEIK